MKCSVQLGASLLACVLIATGCETPSGDAKSPTMTTIDPTQTPKGNEKIPSSAKPGLPNVATPSEGPVTPVVTPLPRVDKMELESFPSAVNLDEVPGPDGVSLKLRLYNLDTPLAFALTQGDLEFVLYEGSIKETEIGAATPFHIWRFSAKQIGQSGRKTIVGWQYAMSLNWDTHVPTSSTVTLVARIPRPGEGPIYAKPVHLAMGPR